MNSVFAVVGFFMLGIGHLFAVVAPAPSIVEEHFEGAYVAARAQEGSPSKVSGHIPKDWAEDSSKPGDNAVVGFAKVSDAASGNGALRISVSSVTSGRAGIRRDGLNLPSDTLLRLRFAVRTPNGASVRLELRGGDIRHTLWSHTARFWSPEWATQELLIPPLPKPEPRAQFVITTDHPMQVDIDDFSLTVVSPDELAAIGHFEGNLLATTSFPDGPSKPWTIPSLKLSGRTAQPDRNVTGPSGLPSLRITPDILTQTATVPYYDTALTTAFVGKPNAVHTFSVALKGQRDGQAVSLVLGSRGKGAATLQQKVTLTTEWKRYHLSGKLPYCSENYFIAAVRASGNESDVFWVDQPQVEVGDSPTAFRRAAAVEIALYPATNFGLHFEDEPLTINAVVYGDVPSRASVTGTLYDAHENAFSVTEQPLKPGQTLQHLKFTIDRGQELPFGYYRFVAEVRQGERVLSRRHEAILVRVRRPRLGDRFAPESPFGIQTLTTEAHVRLARDLGFKWARSLHPEVFSWGQIERPDGTLHWDVADEFVQLNRQYKFCILGVLSGGPPKYSVVPTYDGWGFWRADLKPESRPLYQRFAQTIATRYRQQIRDWETWNETDLGSFYFQRIEGTSKVHAKPENFAAIQQAGYEGIKSADSAIRVWWNLSWATLNVTLPFIESATKAGIFNHLDGYSYHHYNGNFLGYPGDGVQKRIEQVLKTVPADKRHLPVWNSEGGFWPNEVRSLYRIHPPIIGPGRADFFADWVVRYYVSTFANGIPRVFLFNIMNGEFNPGNELLNADGSLSTLCVAFSNLAWHLENKTFRKLVPLANDVNAYLFSDGKDTVAVLLSSKSGRLAIKEAPLGLVARDIFGNLVLFPAQVGDTAMFLTGEGLSPDEMAKRL